jgi:tetratricopeptide (TPR) repeat protein
MEQNIVGNKRIVILAGMLFLALAAWFSPISARAQSASPERFSESLERAESYLNHGKYEEGIIILERLRHREPHDPEVLRLLRRGYQRSKNYGKLLDLLLDRLPYSAKYAEDAGLIADCWFKLDQVELAESTLTAMLTPPPEDRAFYIQAARTYLRNGRYLKAVEIYETAREHFGDPRLFSRQLADLYESRREYAKAIMEYFWDLQENPRSLNTVQKKIAAIVRMEEGTSELSAALRQIVAEHPENFHAHRLYAELLLESGDPVAAWPEYLAADDLAENPSWMSKWRMPEPCPAWPGPIQPWRSWWKLRIYSRAPITEPRFTWKSAIFISINSTTLTRPKRFSAGHYRRETARKSSSPPQHESAIAC